MHSAYNCTIFAEILMLKNYFISNSISEMLVSIGSGINTSKWAMSSLNYLTILTGIILSPITFIIKTKEALKNSYHIV